MNSMLVPMLASMGPLVGVVIGLAACGGGGGGDAAGTAAGGSPAVPAPTPSTPVVNAPGAVLSTQQRDFESFALESQGGYFLLSWSMPYKGAATSSKTAFLAAHHYSMEASPLTAGVQSLTEWPRINMAESLPLPALAAAARSWVMVGDRFVLNKPAQTNIRYLGDTVVRDIYVATGGDQPVYSHRLRIDGVKPLTGKLSAAPEEFKVPLYRLFENDALLDQARSFSAGAALLKVTMTVVGDIYWVSDCREATESSDEPVPCAKATSLVALMKSPYKVSSTETVDWASGQVNSVNGINVWIAHEPYTNPDDPTKRYRILFEKDGAVYVGSLVRDGAILNGTSKRTVVNGVLSKQIEYVPYFALLNEPARQSLKAALKF